MLIRKEYKFYAAHRNEQLTDKCHNVHGHRYGIQCYFDVHRTGALSILFSDFDTRIQPYISDTFDHGMLINVHDPLYSCLCDQMHRTQSPIKLVKFDAPTTVENLAFRLFSDIMAMGFQLHHIEVQETDSSVLVYTKDDWIADTENQSLMRGSLTQLVTRLQDTVCHK